MEQVRVLALAGGVLGADLLEVLAAEPAADVVGVVASHAPGRRGSPCPFAAAWAARHGVPWRYVASWQDGEGVAALEDMRADLMYSLAYDLILPPAALRAGGARAVNLHRGIAPDFRGAYSTNWALELGADELGVTLHTMVPDVDAGAILAQRRIAVEPEWTAAEAIVAVEELAVRTCRETLPALLSGDLPATEQPPGGHVFGRRLPAHELDGLAFPGLDRRIRALWNPPHPSPWLELGSRRFELRETAPGAPLAAPALLAPAAAPRTDNSLALTHGRPVAWLDSPARAVAILRERVALPLALPASFPAEWRSAAGPDARTYAVGDDLQPAPGALADVSAGAAVVLSWPFGQPPERGAAEAIAAAGGTVVEDRTQALLARREPLADWALLEPGATFAVGTSGGLLGPAGADLGAVDGALDEAARFALRFLADVPGARHAAELAAGAWAMALGVRSPWTHWPLGTVAHRYPLLVDDAAGAAAALSARGVPAQAATTGPLAGRLIALPCQGVTDAAIATTLEVVA